MSVTIPNKNPALKLSRIQKYIDMYIKLAIVNEKYYEFKIKYTNDDVEEIESLVNEYIIRELMGNRNVSISYILCVETILVGIDYTNRKTKFNDVLEYVNSCFNKEKNAILCCDELNPHELKRLFKILKKEAQDRDLLIIVIPYDINLKYFLGYYEIKFIKMNTITVELDTPRILIY